MKNYNVFSVLILVSSFSAHPCFAQASSSANVDPYFQLKAPETTFLGSAEVQRPFSAVKPGRTMGDYESSNQAAVGGTITGLEIADLVVRAWEIVQANRPVVNIESKAANAMPNLAKENWAEVTGWQPERWITFSSTIENVYGMKVVDFKYSVHLVYGGSVHGKGLYIASAQVIPNSVKVLWGFNLNVNVDVDSVINTGTEESPVAELGINVTQQYGSVFVANAKVSRYKVNAAGMIKNADTNETYFSSNRKLLGLQN